MKESKFQELSKKLVMDRKSAWTKLESDKKEEVLSLAQDYINFLNKAKTEREAVLEIISWCRKNGFVDLNAVENTQPQPGTRFYFVWKERAAIIGIWGTNPLKRGFRLVGSHLDCPRLDLKPQPVYEQEGLGLCKTHYYGGIKKYQWTAVPLALHGVICTAQGNKISIVIGEDASDPVFTITDLLPHLAKDQMSKKTTAAVAGESLNIIIS